MRLSPLYALLLVAAAGTALAQANSPAPDPATPPATNPMPPTNPTSPTANPDPTARSQDPTAMQGSGPEDWSMIKGHDKGYISKIDALPNSWLAQNFTSCDSDKDGKISPAEYQKCQKRH